MVLIFLSLSRPRNLSLVRQSLHTGSFNYSQMCGLDVMVKGGGEGGGGEDM